MNLKEMKIGQSVVADSRSPKFLTEIYLPWPKNFAL